MYSLPQEIEVWYIIPAIRRELAQVLVRHGLNYEQAGSLLGVSKAAVSQYLHKKRAKEIKFPKEMKKDIKRSAERIVKNKRVVVNEILRLLNLTKKQGVSCQACKKYNKGILKICLAKPIMETRQ